MYTFSTTISFEEVLVCKIESNPFLFILSIKKSDCKTSVAVEKSWFNYHICMVVVLAEPDYCFIGADSILISSLCKKRGRGKKMFAFYVLVSLLNSVSLCLSITSAQVHFSQVFAIIFVLSDCYYCTHCGKLQTLVISIIRLAIKTS